MKKPFHHDPSPDRPRRKLRPIDVLKQRRLAEAAALSLPAPDKGALAAWLLGEAPLSRSTFAAFWAGLDEASREELAAWIGLELDGDEHEAALLG